MQEKWTSRELERQYTLGTFERAVLNPAKVSAALTQMHGAAAGATIKDVYSVELLNLQAGLAGVNYLGRRGGRSFGISC